mmetsp:Transcript_27257/g.57879  ORF Transcript_27257/g.57879 Transcript_27257/m.57879 type:complete len:299 (-) Transcript_27257:147-1043(-)
MSQHDAFWLSRRSTGINNRGQVGFIDGGKFPVIRGRGRIEKLRKDLDLHVVRLPQRLDFVVRSLSPVHQHHRLDGSVGVVPQAERAQPPRLGVLGQLLEQFHVLQHGDARAVRVLVNVAQLVEGSVGAADGRCPPGELDSVVHDQPQCRVLAQDGDVHALLHPQIFERGRRPADLLLRLLEGEVNLCVAKMLVQQSAFVGTVRRQLPPDAWAGRRRLAHRAQLVHQRVIRVIEGVGTVAVVWEHHPRLRHDPAPPPVFHGGSPEEDVLVRVGEGRRRWRRLLLLQAAGTDGGGRLREG